MVCHDLPPVRRNFQILQRRNGSARFTAGRGRLDLPARVRRNLLNLLAVTSLLLGLGMGSAWLDGSSFVFGSVGILLIGLPVARGIMSLRRDGVLLHRIDYGLCRGCGYRLRGCVERCSECGRAFSPHEAAALRADADR